MQLEVDPGAHSVPTSLPPLAAAWLAGLVTGLFCLPGLSLLLRKARAAVAAEPARPTRRTRGAGTTSRRTS
ncbi:hypothetical protein AB0K16_45445 [Nonomuraea jabiensis]|uniref:hypothetical protein n=1 Tax=Nonomuraea jabiensis TaxID=882448 RepID=UPI003444C3B9